MSLSGRVWIQHGYEIGRAISLPVCRDLLAPLAADLGGPRRHAWPRLFGLDEQPVVWTGAPLDVRLGDETRAFTPRLIIYDFGCVSVGLGCEIAGAPDSIRDVAVALARASLGLQAAAFGQLQQFLDQAAAAVVDPEPPETGERYTIFQIDLDDGADCRAWIDEQSAVVAQLLRAEEEVLADDEVREALSHRIRYGRNDVVVVDVAAALVVDREYADTLAVLDFANIERMSMRAIDRDLDRALGVAARLVRSPRRRWRSLLRPWNRDLEDLAAITVDVAEEFESVENAIELTDDHYLARVYRLAMARLHLRTYYEGITRKLQTLWNVHTLLNEQSAARRSEALEWIIILLIAVEVFRFVG